MHPEAKTIPWTERNRTYLLGEFARLRAVLGASAGPAVPVAEASAAMENAPAIDWLCGFMELTSFERDVLLLCAGVEMDAALAQACAARQDTPKALVTFALASAVLEGAHWSALSPTRPLRRFRLVELDAGRGLTQAPLRINERILHYLAGINFLDMRLQTLLRACEPAEVVADCHVAAAAQAVEAFGAGGRAGVVVHLCGDDPQGQEDVAERAAREKGLQLYAVSADDLPPPGEALDEIVLLWEREAALLPGALLVQCGPAGLTPAARHLTERLRGTVLLSGRGAVRLDRPLVRIDLDKPEPAEQRKLWEKVLGPRAAPLNGSLDQLSEQFRLSARTISAAAAPAPGGDGAVTGSGLWATCRAYARPRLDDLAQRINASASWDDLVLPDAQVEVLHQIASQVRHRLKVYETWGFSAKGRRGLGVSALFVGESGTGKTMAAEVLARELRLDLYRIDLSSVVSKYIGETEKNLRQVFDTAEEGGVLLLFDEADALFGKRAEVKDSHDRYANIEVGYLLQRMEAYQGLAILTTNLKSSMDRAFQRRLRFTVNFPFPDVAQREAIWSRAFPAGTPTQGLDPRRLSQLNVAGGNIRNIALNAAFLAAEAGTSVAMGHLLRAAKLEAQKIERPLSEAEVRGWT